jgi:ribosomal protein S18 acetylase RimI-like enzyme
MIRRATEDDIDVIGRIHIAAKDEMTYLPRIPDEDRPRLGRIFFEREEIWVAVRDGRVVGYLGLGERTVEALYVAPDEQNAGVGKALLDHAKRLRPEYLDLWVFQANEGARRFYERHGFRLAELTDGAANMERTPDARYEWTSTE